jgi:hypothetical protein
MLLNQQSQYIDTPKQALLKLMSHQEAIVHKMITTEIQNKYGILSDKPGAGKTFAVLALIMHYKYTFNKKGSNLIVVPYNIYTQWANAIKMFCGDSISFRLFIDYNDISSMYFESDKILSNYDILLTTNLYYHVISGIAKSIDYQFQRVFFDEIDSVANLLVEQIDTKFTWFISASFDKTKMGAFNDKIINFDEITCRCDDKFIDKSIILPEPKYEETVCQNIYFDILLNGLLSNSQQTELNGLSYNINLELTKKIPNNDKEVLEFFVGEQIEKVKVSKQKIKDIENEIDKYLGHSVVYKFIKRLNIIKIKYEEIKLIEDENVTKIINDVDKNDKEEDYIKQMLKIFQNDILKEHFDNFDDIKDLVFGLQYIEKMINDDDIKLDCKKFLFNSKTYIDQLDINLPSNLKTDLVEKYKNSKIDFESSNKKVDIIRERLIKTDICPICYDQIEEKIVLNCCQNVFCFECVEIHFKTRTDCPLCSANLNTSKILKVTNDDFINSSVQKIGGSKLDTIIKIIRKGNNDSKFIVFSDYSNVFKDIIKEFQNSRLKYAEFDGGSIEELDKVINNFRFGDTNILMANSSFYGCGMNLEQTTDIILVHKIDDKMKNQIIGRAQRFGRKTALNIYQLYHENEINI